MLTNLEKYHRPDDLDQTIHLLDEKPKERTILAGGTSVVASGASDVSEVIDIQNLPLDGVERSGETLLIGALTPLVELQNSQLLRDNDLDILCQAALDKPSQLIRNQATVGGELATGNPRSELATVLMALDARLTVEGAGGVRTLSLESFYDGNGGNALDPTEIITEVEVAVPADDAQLFYDRLSRTENDISLVNLAFAARKTADGWVDARIAAGAVDGAVVRLPEVEAYVEDDGFELDQDRLNGILEETVNPPDDFRASADYRRTILGVFINRAISGEQPVDPKTNGEVELG